MLGWDRLRKGSPFPELLVQKCFQHHALNLVARHIPDGEEPLGGIGIQVCYDSEGEQKGPYAAAYQLLDYHACLPRT